MFVGIAMFVAPWIIVVAVGVLSDDAAVVRFLDTEGKLITGLVRGKSVEGGAVGVRVVEPIRTESPATAEM